MLQNEYKFDNKLTYRLIISGSVKSTKTAVFDADKLNLVKRHKWRVDTYGYLQCTCHQILMHRLVMSAPDDLFVDHINGNKVCNKLKNLRLVSPAQNAYNRKSKNSYIGVDLPVAGVKPTQSGKWQALITIRGHTMTIGTFEHVYDACLARVLREYQLFGVYSPEHRHWIDKLPLQFKAKWLPEIYGRQNEEFIDTKIFIAHFKRVRDSGIKQKLRRLRRADTNV